jgi:hypothetical protein
MADRNWVLISSVLVSSFPVAGNASAVINIPAITGPASPSYRGATNTTWFGWSSGTFDGSTDDGRLDNPAPTLGTTTAGVGLVQTDPAATIVSSSNNIYSGFGFPLAFSISAPTDGNVGAGFTTIIVQGRAAFGAFGDAFSFGNVGGDAAELVVGINAAAAGQFFAKYEIPGNAASYLIPVTGGSAVSINNLQVDTYWSSTGYAPDFAVTPEPSTLAAIAGSVGLVGRPRRRV